jgi:hypothetical protein
VQLARKEDGFGCLFCFRVEQKDEIGIGIAAAVGEWGVGTVELLRGEKF